MSVLKRNIVYLGCANHAEIDTGTQGGAIDKTVKMTFADLASGSDTVFIRSDEAADTTPTVTVTGRDADGTLISEVETLTGLTAAGLTDSDFERILKAVKSGTCAGTVCAYYDIALSSQTITQAGTVNSVTLHATEALTAAEAQNAVLMVTIDATLVIREIVDYNATTKVATVGDVFGTAPDADDTYTVHKGIVFDKISGETEVLEVRRPFYNAIANEAGGASKDYYEGLFAYNNGDKTYTSAVIKESSDPTTNVTFDIDTDGLNGTDTATNRLTAPTGDDYNSFDSADKNVSNSQNLLKDNGQQIWIKLTLAAGESPDNSYWQIELVGATT